MTIQQKMVNTAGMLNGLISQADRSRDRAIDINFASKRSMLPAGCVERYCPSFACYRTTSQRSLSNPTTFLSTSEESPWGSGFGLRSLMNLMLLDPASGAIPPLAGEDTLRFNDSNRPQDRARLEGQVLIAIRSKVAVMFQWGQNLVGPPTGPYFNSGLLVETMKEFIRQYVAIAVFHTSDDIVQTGIVAPAPGIKIGEPWVGFTPLKYFDRDGDGFVPVAPLLWPAYNRQPNMQIGLRQAEHGPLGAENIDINDALIPFFDAAISETAPRMFTNTRWQASILVEALFVPPPEACDGSWPGELCPTHKIGGHPDYNEEIPAPAPALDEPIRESEGKSCSGCGCKRSAPPAVKQFGILDPRHNMREAVKQMILLEDHLFHEEKVCGDCIQKHCLTIEALGEEGVTLDKTNGSPSKTCSKIARFGRRLESRIRSGEDKKDVAADIREYRKELGAALRSMST